MKLLILISIISSFLLCFSTARDKVSMPVDKLIQRICTIARDKLHIQNATPESRQEILNSMKEKLKKTSESLGVENTGNIRLIIQGVTILSIEENYQKLCNNNKASPAERRQFFKDMQMAHEALSQSEIVTRSQTNMETELSDANINETTTTMPAGGEAHKIAEIKTLIGKMETVMMRAVKDDMTNAQKMDVAKQLKHQFLEAFRRAYHKSEKLNTYLSLVEQGMNLAVEKLIHNDLRRSKDGDVIGEEALAEDAKPKQSKTDMHKMRSSDQTKELAKHPLPEQELPSPSADPTTSTTSFPGITKGYGCNDILKDTCVNLKSLDKFACNYDATSLELQQVCDGNVDCPDGSDEKNCIQQVIGKIHNATQVMAKVEMSQNCFKSIIDKSLLSKQGDLLSSLLNTQVDFLNKYTQRGLHLPPSTNKSGEKDAQKKLYYNQSINELAYEVAVIVRSFASTLTNALCHMEDKIKRDITDIVGEDFDRQVEQLEIEARTAWLPSSCKCNNEYCANITNCNNRCKRYCYQVYSLQNFNCKPINKGQSGVPLDLVCDGKIDCFDETDENDCRDDGNKPLYKFEGSKLFNQIINLINSKAMTKEFTPVRVEMAELSTCIHGLQRHSTTLQPDIEQLKYARNKCFSKMADIFETMLEEGDLPKEIPETIYDFLLMTNENIISAMKHTHVGNKNIISPEDCLCHESACLQVNCPERCVRVCAVKTLLVNYNCSSSGGKASIPLEGICDGKNNCPNGEDEINCKKDFCRIHHLRVIGRNIKTLCDRYHGTNIGDVLEKWRSKVVARFAVLEKRERLTPKVFKFSVRHMVNDLALTYASLTPTRRTDTDKIRIKKFTKLSQYIMEMLKECTK